MALGVFKGEDHNLISGICIGFGSAAGVLGIGNLILSFMISENNLAK
ncbi:MULTISPECIES: hypothetical protein [Clostridium]|nr:hypothetical protein [Clostridium cadaveris]MDU4951376.1 hypothetical protein [Clostridium sp.]